MSGHQRSLIDPRNQSRKDPSKQRRRKRVHRHHSEPYHGANELHSIVRRIIAETTPGFKRKMSCAMMVGVLRGEGLSEAMANRVYSQVRKGAPLHAEWVAAFTSGRFSQAQGRPATNPPNARREKVQKYPKSGELDEGSPKSQPCPKVSQDQDSTDSKFDAESKPSPKASRDQDSSNIKQESKNPSNYTIELWFADDNDKSQDSGLVDLACSGLLRLVSQEQGERSPTPTLKKRR